MAGSCKPENAGIEGKYTVIQSALAYNYLFNENNTTNNYQTNSGYWNTTARYLTIELHQTSNIYRSGISSYPSYNKKLTIYQYNKYTQQYDINVTDKYTIETTAIGNGVWEMFVSNIPKGKYKFVCNELYRMDSEWYIEESPIYLLKMNNKYYSVKDEHYDVDTQAYKPIEYNYDELNNLVFQRSALFQEVTINEETFKPIDKFDNFSFVQVYDEPLKVCGTKSLSELIVANGDIDATMATQINSFTLTTNRTDGTVIKVALSTDKGSTWYTYSEEDSTLLPLNVNIPLKDYNYKSDMSETDIVNYKNAKEEILANGIDVDILSSVPFYRLLENCETIRFAYVVQMVENGTAEIDKLSWDFNSTGRMYKMKDSEVEVDIYAHSVLVTSLIDNDMIKTNIAF